VEHEKKHTSDRVLGFLPSLGTGIGGGDLSPVDLPQIKGREATCPRTTGWLVTSRPETTKLRL
jgi:hypothetical protein